MWDISERLNNKDSRLCIGLDPRVRQSKRLEFAMEIVEKTKEFAFAYKPNIQFWHGTAKSELTELTKFIHDFNIPIIADLKISDIGSSNRAALENMSELGFDYITHSPFPGNVKETSEEAKDVGIGLITLVLMSNPEAKWMIDSGMYLQWAIEVERYCDGAVIGTTNHVTKDILQELASTIKTKFILAPGLGAQGGEVGDLKKLFGNRVLFNVSRGINQSENPFQAAQEYYNNILALN